MSFMCASDSRITEKSLGSTCKGPRAASIGTTDKMDVEHTVIDDMLVRRMVAAQFPQWADLPVPIDREAHALASGRCLFGAHCRGRRLALCRRLESEHRTECSARPHEAHEHDELA